MNFDNFTLESDPPQYLERVNHFDVEAGLKEFCAENVNVLRKYKAPRRKAWGIFAEEGVTLQKALYTGLKIKEA